MEISIYLSARFDWVFSSIYPMIYIYHPSTTIVINGHDLLEKPESRLVPEESSMRSKAVSQNFVFG
jgi:hypothetical protein